MADFSWEVGCTILLMCEFNAGPLGVSSHLLPCADAVWKRKAEYSSGLIDPALPAGKFRLFRRAFADASRSKWVGSAHCFAQRDVPTLSRRKEQNRRLLAAKPLYICRPIRRWNVRKGRPHVRDRWSECLVAHMQSGRREAVGNRVRVSALSRPPPRQPSNRGACISTAPGPQAPPGPISRWLLLCSRRLLVTTASRARPLIHRSLSQNSTSIRFLAPNFYLPPSYPSSSTPA